MVRLLSGLACLALLTNAINGVSLPEPNNALNILEEHAGIAPRSADIISPEHALERRKGGGGRGGGSSGGSSGGGRGGGGSRTSSSSTVGGSTRLGSGPSRSYGGGYYGGGAAVPYTAGSRTPKGLIAAPLLVGGAALVVMPGLWLYSVYPYHYNNPYRFYNRSANATDNNNNNNKARDLVSLVTRQAQMGANQTLPVICLCQENSVCGCDENQDEKYLNDLVGNGSYAALNKTLVTVSDVNNTRTLVINGTLPPGTTAPGGVDDAAASLMLGKNAWYWVFGLCIFYGAML